MKYAALLEDFQEPIKRPRYFLILKYTLIAYLVLHVAYLIITLPFGLQDLEHSGHPHASELHLLWIISVIYCIIFSSIGLFAVYKEHFSLLLIFSISMVINLLILVYAATLHEEKTTFMIGSLLINWFFASLAIAFTKLVLDPPLVDVPLQSSGYFHNIYVPRERRELN